MNYTTIVILLRKLSTTKTTTTTTTTTSSPNIPLKQLVVLVVFHHLRRRQYNGIRKIQQQHLVYKLELLFVHRTVMVSSSLLRRKMIKKLLRLVVELNGWKLANNVSPTVHITVTDTSVIENPILLEEYLAEKENIISLQTKQALEIIQNQQRYFALDVTPTFILASGRAVQGMLASGVADYLEFKAVEGLYWLEQTKKFSSQGM